MQLVSGTFQLSASDLTNHLSCGHLTQLNRAVARGELKKPSWYDPSVEVLIQRGQQHEAAYVKYLQKQGLTVENLKGQSLAATIDAMQRGVDVIVQARLDHRSWLGYADILRKTAGKSKFGNWMYEIEDTKLAHNTRAATILQLCLYSDLLAQAQDAEPEKMYVVKPGADFPKDTYRYSDFRSYYNVVRKNFETVMSQPDCPTYPDPVEHCGICRWWQVCDKKRHDDDHLSLVAGMRSLHIAELQRQQIQTLEQLALAEKIERPKRGNYDTLLRRQEQAKIQLKGRERNELLYALLPVEPGRGFHRLPEPDAGDIYFDIEGDPFYEDGGIEYLLGFVYREAVDQDPVYEKHWATDRTQEKKAFAAFMTFVTERWKRYPNLHLYHFTPYEPAALKRLARVHALYEKEIDDLLRAERFVDLHAVFKEALLASVETYSLKELERFTRYLRETSLHDASSARKSVEIALELKDVNSLSKDILRVVESYNEDDCRATEALHQWLENLRNKLADEGHTFQRPAPEPQEVSERLAQQEIRSQALFKALTENLPENREAWSEEDKAKWLLAHQMDYFRREDKSAWWEYFRVHEMEQEDLLDERKAITGLRFVEALPLKPREKIPVHRYTFPPQEVTLSEGDDLIEVKGEKIGTVQSVSLENNTIDIKKTSKTIDVHPVAVHVYERVDPGTLWTSIMNLAAAICEDGLNPTISYHAAKDMLMKRKPRLINGEEGAYLLPGENTLEGAIRIALQLNRSILPIQGPPGTGKTYTGARMIVALVKAGKKVGITAISHRVIATLLEKVKELGDAENVSINFFHKVTEKPDYIPEWVTQVKDTKKAIAMIAPGNIVGGTAWLWADDQAREALDYLFIDEAGQMSLSQALAAAGAAMNLVLLGDPQQLEQPQKGAHPEGSDVAALTYLLEGKPTMTEGKGLFLEVTRRIHPEIARFTSEIFYEGKLHALPELKNQAISGGTPFDGAGLFYVPTVHTGNQNQSLQEVEIIAGIVDVLLKTGRWTDAANKTYPLSTHDILIVAPYNAQVSALSERLPGMRIGTVDKFQGQEAPVVIYSMTSSSHEDAPRGMSFLYSPNRLNVATSRAKCICILVASPALLEPACRTIDQMKWANALCRLREMAKVVEWNPSK